LDAPAAAEGATAHTESELVANDTRILLLAAVPYVAGVATHVVNALHSHRVNERRYGTWTSCSSDPMVVIAVTARLAMFSSIYASACASLDAQQTAKANMPLSY
jgi:hypothetical protein